jgi:hypothetical protein
MKESKSVKWGMDIAQAYHEMMEADEPTFCNFNGMYLYGGCKTPPHECADKQTMRTILAGMALPKCIETVNQVLLAGGKVEAKTTAEAAAQMAVTFTDALLSELNKEKEEETSHE